MNWNLVKSILKRSIVDEIKFIRLIWTCSRFDLSPFWPVAVLTIPHRTHEQWRKCQTPSKRRTDGRTDKETSLLQGVDESRRRRHGVTAAIVVDVVAVRVRVSVRPSFRSSLRWSLTQFAPGNWMPWLIQGGCGRHRNFYGYLIRRRKARRRRTSTALPSSVKR